MDPYRDNNQLGFSMTLQKRVPNCYIQIAIRALGHENISSERILEGTGLTTESLAAGIHTNTEQLVRVINNSRAASNNPAIGLLLGHQLHPSTHGSVGWAAINNPTLTGAIEIFQRYSHLRTPFMLYRPMVSSKHYIIRLVMTENLGTAQTPFIEAMLLLLQHVIEFILGRPVKEGELYINSKPPAYAKLYADFFSCPVHFNAEHLELRLPLELQNTTNPSADEAMYQLALEQCREMAINLQRKNNISTEVHDYISSHIGQAVTLDKISQDMNVSSRTLIRQLKKQETSLQVIKDDVYAFQSANYLRRSSLSVNAISAIFGYQDSANFRRSFKRWFKKSPQQYRDEYLKQAS